MMVLVVGSCGEKTPPATPPYAIAVLPWMVTIIPVGMPLPILIDRSFTVGGDDDSGKPTEYRRNIAFPV
jgi:hypothetical protein